MARFSFLKGKRGEYLVVLQFVLFFAFVLAPGWNPLATPQLLAWLAPVRWAALVLIGAAAILVGLLGMRNIREYLTPLPYPVDHNQLVQHGVYAIIRHPLYSSQLYAACAWTLYTLSLTHLAILVAGFLFFDFKARKEEAWLTQRHPEYADYAQRVCKFVPWIY